MPLAALQPQQVLQQQLVQALLQDQALLQLQVVLMAALQTQGELLLAVRQQQQQQHWQRLLLLLPLAVLHCQVRQAGSRTCSGTFEHSLLLPQPPLLQLLLLLGSRRQRLQTAQLLLLLPPRPTPEASYSNCQRGQEQAASGRGASASCQHHRLLLQQGVLGVPWSPQVAPLAAQPRPLLLLLTLQHQEQEGVGSHHPAAYPGKTSWVQQQEQQPAMLLLLAAAEASPQLLQVLVLLQALPAAVAALA
jgi:hypothetical protein